MEYHKYIDLGFDRTDMDDSIEFQQTGYYGFTLEKQINDRMFICVSSGELDQPKLYIRKRGSQTNHIFKITPECVIDLVDKAETQN